MKYPFNRIQVQKKYALREVYEYLESKQVSLSSYYLSAAKALGVEHALTPVFEVDSFELLYKNDFGVGVSFEFVRR